MTSVDAAALAAARALSEGETQAEQQAAVNLMVQQLFDANFPDDFMMAGSRNYDTPTIIDNGDGTRTVLVAATVTVPTYFLRFAGYNDLPISASATALRRDVNLMLVLDRSGSMKNSPGSNPGPTAFQDLQFASQPVRRPLRRHPRQAGLGEFRDRDVVGSCPCHRLQAGSRQLDQPIDLGQFRNEFE